MTAGNPRLDEGTVVQFEVVPTPGFQTAGTQAAIGKLREAIEPLVPEITLRRANQQASP